MAGRRSGDAFKHLSSLFRVGTLAGVPDAQLLERFVAGRDEAGEMAFRALVERHGPMVLRVCQSVLGDRHDAEDAFQVTFLVLARKAGSIRKQRSLGSWLHGVAHRVALRAQTAARRRLARETKAAKRAEMAAPSAEPGEDRADLAAALHQEITRLPAKYRAPIVLCYLEGMTHDQAASELGWPVGTVRGRLARARDMLRTRLTRRGLTLVAGLGRRGVATGDGVRGASGRPGGRDGRRRTRLRGGRSLDPDRGAPAPGRAQEHGPHPIGQVGSAPGDDRPRRRRRGHARVFRRNEALRRADLHREVPAGPTAGPDRPGGRPAAGRGPGPAGDHSLSACGQSDPDRLCPRWRDPGLV